MTVREIVAAWLRKHGYDGLYDDDCGCLVDDLMPCGEGWSLRCEAGYKSVCPDRCEERGNLHLHIGPGKPSVPTKQCQRCKGRGYYGGYTLGSGRNEQVFPPLRCRRCEGSGKVRAIGT